MTLQLKNAPTTAVQLDSLAIHLDSIGQIALTVRDLVESRDFYQNTLGLKLLFEAGQMVFFQCGSLRLMIGLAERPTTPDGTILYFRVAEIHSVAAALKTKSVEFVQQPHLVASMPGHDLWMAFLKDPSGNTLALMSEVARG
jgi:methylmalonyl-CoA/ethylmalonyl-CoA epimerase